MDTNDQESGRAANPTSQLTAHVGVMAAVDGRPGEICTGEVGPR